MKAKWRVQEHRLGWVVMCDGPLGIAIEFWLYDELEQPVDDWIFNTRVAAEALAALLNEMEDARR